jgi:hypothetical protein
MRTMTRCGVMKKRLSKAETKRDKTEPVVPTRSPRIGVPWGRASSKYRPGLFVKKYLVEQGEACQADIFYAISQEIVSLNQERINSGEKVLKMPNYSSFSKYFHWFLLLGLVERTGRREPAVYDFLKPRVFYRLTEKGRAAERAWADPVKSVHPEFRK